MDLFPETRWTILAEATLNGDAASQKSLSSICEKYTGPVDKMVKLKGVPDDRVEDVRQDFFIVEAHSRCGSKLSASFCSDSFFLDWDAA